MLSAISVIIFIQPEREQNDDKSQNLCMLCCQFSVPHQRLQLDNTCQESAFEENCTINCPHLNDNAAEWSKMPKTYFTLKDCCKVTIGVYVRSKKWQPIKKFLTLVP